MRIALSLVSHTNAGKTTLARTLLQRSVGEVRDAPHVTVMAEDHLLLRSEAGDELRLWDTPGFGDTVRLVRRLRQHGTPLGWFLTEVWDRWRDKPLWASQQAVRHVRDTTDVVLYLINASEQPAAAPYVDAEMQLLAWVDRPILVLLNQLGMLRSAEQEAQDVERWQAHLRDWPRVRAVLPLDAFGRCWVQESVLWTAVGRVLDAPRAEAMGRLEQAWRRERLAVFDAAAASLARTLASVATTRVPLQDDGALSHTAQVLAARLGQVWRKLSGGEPGRGDPRLDDAERALCAHLDEQVRQGTAELIALHGLTGAAQGEILQRVAQQVQVSARVDEGRAAVWGGMVTGALAGLKADLLAGGLTLGGGLIAGGVLGAMGAAGVARGINVWRGGGPGWVGWRSEAMGAIVEAALLRYLAVAHFGRGRGDWAQGEAPPHWLALVREVVQRHQPALQALWDSRSTTLDGTAGDAARLGESLRPLVATMLADALRRLYPQAASSLPDAQSAP